MLHFYHKIDDNREDCFNIDSEELTEVEIKTLTWLLAETFEPENLQTSSFFVADNKDKC